MSEGAFWNDQEHARDIVQQVKQLKGWVDPFDALEARTRSARELDEMLNLEPDESMTVDVDAEVERLAEELDAFELRTLLRGRDDFRDAQLEISAGAGGTEAQDWAQMIMRMYVRWAERKGFAIEMLDLSEGEEAGIKGAVLEIKGLSAYGFLRGESGVHRLVRISPFDAQARRHTSFASVFVYPVVDDEINIEIRDEDLRIDVYRASGAGGQHVNKTSSAVRITHLPTGIVVSCQNERSQLQNKEVAMRVLKARLAEVEARKFEQKMADIRGDQQRIEWGSQIRSYVFQPYTQVTDLRSRVKVGDVQAVMDGNLEELQLGYLRWHAGKGATGEAQDGDDDQD